MNQAHFKDFSALLTNIAEQYSKTPSDSLITLYWQGLHDLEFKAVSDALFRHIRRTDKEGKFMPKISDIREMLEGSTEDSSYAAWTKVDKALRTIGPYQSVVFDDPLIHRVLEDMGGWVQLGTKEDSEWPFVAREFQNRYKGYKSRGLTPECRSHMIGLTEANNLKEGFKIDDPVLIGDKDKAKLIADKSPSKLNDIAGQLKNVTKGEPEPKINDGKYF
ncbi:MAG: DUF6475 domain-containing protein [Gammaproteobacteria bacterium]|nr:DUF6475 domain-containing protein [Gammaproteobacteria bacterium]